MTFRRAGFGLKDIKLVLQRISGDHASCRTIEETLSKYAQLIEKKRKELDACEEIISEIGGSCVSCHKTISDPLSNECPMINNIIQNDAFAETYFEGKLAKGG